MPNSSAPDPTPQLDAVGLEQAEKLEAAPPEHALGESKEAGTGGWITAAWALPGGLWLGFFLLAPLVFIVLVSFWTYELGAKSGFTTKWTLSNYGTILHSSTYWHNMLGSFYTSLIAVVVCLLLGFPVAYFLALKVHTLRNQIALFIIALAPFWTSFLVRSVAWTYPLSEVLGKFGISTPSTGSVRLAFVAVILPQTLPGIVIGSIFIFVLTMGEYGTVLVVGQNYVQSVGTIVNSYIVGAVQYPQGAAAAVLLVLALIVGVFAITRFSNLREEL